MTWGVSRAECCHRSGLVPSCCWVICLLAVDDMDHLVGALGVSWRLQRCDRVTSTLQLNGSNVEMSEKQCCFSVADYGSFDNADRRGLLHGLGCTCEDRWVGGIVGLRMRRVCGW